MFSSAIFRPSRPLGDIVETIWDLDIADGAAARSFTLRALPTPYPLMSVHYRASMRAVGRLTSGSYRHIAFGIQTEAVTRQASGPLGVVMVRFKPEAAARIMGYEMNTFAGNHVALGDVFGATEMSLLEEMLAEAKSAAERVARIEAFLLRHTRTDEVHPAVRLAVRCLQTDPRTSVTRLARQLDISERHLSRRFHTMVGASPKQFARVVRLVESLRLRRCGTTWADIAAACGFTDQAHMIKDYRSMAGIPPEAFTRAALAANHPLNGELGESGFYNTFAV